jgi:phospholipid/cholesterol/gamma-HCH transport system substrate-binding protein
MQTKTLNNAKLGLFVLSGLLFLVVLLYLIGKNQNLFGDTYELKARFENVQGLVPGNNVRYAGIEAGTVKSIQIINDTTLEVTMIIEKLMNQVIRRNAILTIGTEGIVGNKVINIAPSKQSAALAVEGDVLLSRKSVDTDDMLQTLSQTNIDVALIAAELKTTVTRINKSKALWELLEDRSLPRDVRKSLANIRIATGKAVSITDQLNSIVADMKEGKGSVGSLLRDSGLVKGLTEAVQKINKAGAEMDTVISKVNTSASILENDLQNGKGVVHAFLRDTVLVNKVQMSLSNIEKGTDGFNQNMEALKHNFLFRGYFRKLEKEKAAALKRKENGDK